MAILKPVDREVECIVAICEVAGEREPSKDVVFPLSERWESKPPGSPPLGQEGVRLWGSGWHLEPGPQRIELQAPNLFPCGEVSAGTFLFGGLGIVAIALAPAIVAANPAMAGIVATAGIEKALESAEESAPERELPPYSPTVFEFEALAGESYLADCHGGRYLIYKQALEW